VYELEALRPSERAGLLTNAIDEVIDAEAFNHELKQEERDAARIEGFRRTMIPVIRRHFNEQQGEGGADG
jgi:hypothetical protein